MTDVASLGVQLYGLSWAPSLPGVCVLCLADQRAAGTLTAKGILGPVALTPFIDRAALLTRRLPPATPYSTGPRRPDQARTREQASAWSWLALGKTKYVTKFFGWLGARFLETIIVRHISDPAASTITFPGNFLEINVKRRHRTIFSKCARQ